jgi:hypothetical protein
MKTWFNVTAVRREGQRALQFVFLKVITLIAVIMFIDGVHMMCSLNVWRIGVSFNLTFWDALPEASSRES